MPIEERKEREREYILLLQHLQDKILLTKPHTCLININNALPFLQGHLMRWGMMPADTSTVDAVVDSFEYLSDLLDRVLNGWLVCHVGLYKRRLNAEILRFEQLVCIL